MFVACSGEDAPYTDDVIIKRQRYDKESDHLAFFIERGKLNGMYRTLANSLFEKFSFGISRSLFIRTGGFPILSIQMTERF